MTVNGEKLVCGSIKGCLNCKYADCISKGRKIYAVSEEQRKRNNERKKQLIQERRENGICTSCGKRPADAGRKMCGICRERYRQYKEAENRRKGVPTRDALDGVKVCAKCGKAPPMPPHRTCERCYKSCMEKLAKTPTHRGVKRNDLFRAVNDYVQDDLRAEETGRETVKRKKENPIAVGDAVIVRRQCADGGVRMARGVVRFAAQGGRFYVVNVELVPCALRNEVMMMRETFWPEDVERERIEG